MSQPRYIINQAPSPDNAGVAFGLANDWFQYLSASVVTVAAVSTAEIQSLSSSVTSSLQSLSSSVFSAIDTKQPLNSQLTALAAIAPSDNDFLQGQGGIWVKKTLTEIKTSLAYTVDIPYSAVGGASALTANITRYFPMSGTFVAGTSSAGTAGTSGLSGSVVGMYVRLTTNSIAGAASTEWRLWVNNASTALVVTLGVGVLSGNDLNPAHEVIVSPTDLVQYRYTHGAGAPGVIDYPSITTLFRKRLT